MLFAMSTQYLAGEIQPAMACVTWGSRYQLSWRHEGRSHEAGNGSWCQGSGERAWPLRPFTVIHGCDSCLSFSIPRTNLTSFQDAPWPSYQSSSLWAWSSSAPQGPSLSPATLRAHGTCSLLWLSLTIQGSAAASLALTLFCARNSCCFWPPRHPHSPVL